MMLSNCGVEDLRVAWTAGWSNKSNLKETNPEYSLEGLMLRWKLQYFGHLIWRTDSLEKILMPGKIEGRIIRERQDEMVGWHHWSIDMSLGKLRELVMDREAWHAEIHGVTKNRIWLSNWTELNCGQESLRRNGVAIIVNKSPKCSTGKQSQNRQNDLCSFPKKTVGYHGNSSLCPDQ